MSKCCQALQVKQVSALDGLEGMREDSDHGSNPGIRSMSTVIPASLCFFGASAWPAISQKESSPSSRAPSSPPPSAGSLGVAPEKGLQ